MTLTSLIIFLCVMVVMALLSAMWSAAETALFSLSQSDRVRLRKLSPQAASQAAYLLNRPRLLLISLLMANTIVATSFYVVASIFATDLKGWGALLVSVASLVVLTMGAEILPKTLASVNRVFFARACAPVAAAWFRIAGPVCGVCDRYFITPMTRLLLPRKEGEESISVEELGELLEVGGSAGAIDEREQRLLAEVLELGMLRVRDVMAPRVDIAWLDERATAAQVVELVLRTGHRKYPVCRGGLEKGVVGMLDAQHYLAARSQRSGKGDPVLSSFLEPVRYVPERSRLDQLLDHFRRTRTHLALAVDEVGAVTGLVEVEDAVKELVRTQPEVTGRDVRIEKLAPGRWIVPGRLGVRHWADFFGRDLSAADGRRVATVGGLVMARLGRMPRAGDVVIIGGVRLRVDAMDGTLVERVEVSIEPALTDPGNAGGGAGVAA